MSGSLVRPVILLVEDSEDDAFFFRHALKKTALACSVFHMADGAAAIRYFRSAWADRNNAEHPWPDLVFLDLKLPTFSGFEILAWIREQKTDAPLSITVLSGSEHASDLQRAKSLGAEAYLVKPIATELLRERIQGWVKMRAAAAPAEMAPLPTSS